MVEKAWNTPCPQAKSIDRWQAKVRTLRRIVRGWAANEVANLNRSKVALSKDFTRLESLAEVRSLSPEESGELRNIEYQLEQIWALEEIKSRQRSRDRDLLEGDRNTTYFQAIANHRSRKKRIDCLQGLMG